MVSHGLTARIVSSWSSPILIGHWAVHSIWARKSNTPVCAVQRTASPRRETRCVVEAEMEIAWWAHSPPLTPHRLKMKALHLALVLTTILFASCAGTRVSGNHVKFAQPMKVIAASAAGGSTSQAIVAEMQNDCAAGIEVKPGAETIEILKGLGIPSIRAHSPENLRKLRAAGLDGFMRITATRSRSGVDAPGKITIRLYSTLEIGHVIEFVWENAWGGAPGSPADAVMRVDLDAAVKEVTQRFLARL